MKISSLQFATLKQQNDYRNVFNLVEDLKKSNEQNNDKTILLEQEDQRIRKRKLND